MSALVTGTFEAEGQAAQAVRKLLRSCVPSAHVRTMVARSRAVASHGGITVAVNAFNNVAQFLAMQVLREHGARDVRRVPVTAPPPRRQRGKALSGAQQALPL